MNRIIIGLILGLSLGTGVSFAQAENISIDRELMPIQRAEHARARRSVDFGVSAFRSSRRKPYLSRDEREFRRNNLSERRRTTPRYGQHYKSLRRQDRSTREERGNLLQQQYRFIRPSSR
ncbi:hypothetical protein K9M59_04460 [Candidatus Gracilibacteria bacterium]|nr:hypothetical protein [Candidatus Gracilibacteria bacterium]MCF7819572.1 hypothetical protein [Candidatus Gracilibacteria bacterium]